jgi:hypothetical protein
MNSYHVFIPSRGRWQGARKLTEIWLEHGFEVHWVVEPSEHNQYFDSLVIPYSGAKRIGVPSTYVHPLPRPNMGIGFSRHHCINLAASYGLRTMLLADDDIKPGRLVEKANMKNFVECAGHSKVLGITARYGYHDLCLGDKIKDREDLILLPSGTFRLVALNVNNVLSLGNYDKSLEYAEDCDLFLRGLKYGFPWMIHLGTWTNSIGGRYQPGGILDYAKSAYSKAEVSDLLKVKKHDWHWELYDKYPNFVNDPAKADFSKQNSIRISWRKAYNMLLPDWQKWSALHGGYLADYLGITK